MATRLGIFGGTFDPVHNAHLLKASEVAHRLALPAVVFMPAGRPWQKDPRTVSSAEDRYAMVRLAVASDPRLTVSRLEIDRHGPTFTADTLRELRHRLGPEAELYFIAGADVLATIATWRDAEVLGALARFVVCSRPGYEPDGARLPGTGHATLLDVPTWEISSTVIRHRVSLGLPIRYLTPDPVVDYIQRRGLYREAARAAPSSPRRSSPPRPRAGAVPP